MIKILEQILDWYRSHNDWINLIKDIVFFSGTIVIVKYLWNWNFEKKTKEIEANLRFRERIEATLQEYAYEKYKNDKKDIGIRFVHWKNYPCKLNNDDGHKHLLKVDYLNDKLVSSSWIDNIGIYFQVPLSSSIYVDAKGIFFFAPNGKQYPGFIEYRDKRLVFQLPFTKIVNFDFREIIEYEPVFYIRDPYTNYNKLYSHKFIVREKPGGQDFSIELDSKKQLARYSWTGYMFKIVLFRLFSLKHYFLERA